MRAFTPPTDVLPAVRVTAPTGTAVAETGAEVALSALASGVGLDAAELVVDGQPVVALDESAPRARWTVPGGSVAGQRHALQVRVRGAGGTEALSPVLTVEVKAPTTGAPAVALDSPAANQQLRSGALVTLSARRTGGLSPATMVARLGTLSLGRLFPDAANPQVYKAPVRLPVVDAAVEETLTVVLSDGAGRVAEASTPVRLLADSLAPGVPAGLPAQLRAGPYVNAFQVYASDDGVVSLELEKDGVGLATSPEANGNANLAYALLLPEDAVGTQVTLKVTARDAAGRQTPVEKTYTVAPDGVAPKVTLYSTQPPTTAIEGSNIQVQATASDVDGDLAGIQLYADGALIGTGTGTFVTATYTMPLLAVKSAVVFRAVATDKRGRTDFTERTTTVLANLPPVLRFTMTPTPPALRGETVTVCVEAKDNANIETFVATVEGAPLGAPTSCGAGCRSRCLAVTAGAAATQLVAAASASDDLGALTENTHTFPVVANQPPVVALAPLTSVSKGVNVTLSGSVQDERGPLAWAEFRVNGALVGTRMNAPGVGASLKRTWSPPTVGVIRISLVAQDQLGLVGESFQDVMVVDPQEPTGVIAADDMQYEGMDILVQGSKTLRIDGAHTFRNLYVLGGATLTHSEQGVSGRNLLDLTVTQEVRVDSSSKIDVSGRGYLGGWRGANQQRPGLTTGHASTGKTDVGGSHGGYGYAEGYKAGSNPPTPVYGDYWDPDDFGAGGSGGVSSTSLGGSGGGLIRLRAGSMKLDGRLLANDGPTNSRAGAGGGIRVDVGALTGVGSMEAGSISGAGGRVAVYYDTETSSFDWSKVSAKGGTVGGAGTVYLKGSLQQDGELILNNGDNSPSLSSVKPTPVPGGTYDRFAVRGRAVVEVEQLLTTPTLEVNGGSVVFLDELAGGFTTLRVQGGGTLDLRQPWSYAAGMAVEVTGNNSALRVTGGAPLRLSNLKVTGTGATLALNANLDGQPRSLELEAPTVEVGSGASIDATGAGYLGGHQGVNELEPGRTTGNVSSGKSVAGGSHGGHGYSNVLAIGAVPVPTYGDSKNPSDFGSGGSGGNPAGALGGNGGGLLRLTVDTLQLNGTVRANGGKSAGPFGGAGGSVRVDVGALTGTGALEAVGADNGGGGRVAVYYDTARTSFDWSKVSARGGNAAGPGTVFLKGSQQQDGELILDHGTSTVSTNNPKPTRVPGGTYDRFVARNKAFVEVTGALWASDLLVDGASVIVQGALSGDLTALRVLGSGGLLDLRQPWAFADGLAVEVNGANAALRVTGGNPLRLSTLKVTGTGATLALNASLDGSAPQPLALEAATVEVGTGASLDVSGAGYLGGWQGANEQRPGRTVGNVSTGRNAAAGSHGGFGDVESSSTAVPLHGDLHAPMDSGAGGSGGAVSSLTGASGGGVLWLKAGSLKLDGRLLSNGARSLFSTGYDGAGGSIRLEVGALTGTGSIQASGGGDVGSGGGGGGRVAVTYDTATSTFDWSRISAPGGVSGGTGTVFLKGSQQPNGELVLDQSNHALNRAILAPTVVSTGTYDRILARNAAWAEILEGVSTSIIQVEGTGTGLLLSGVQPRLLSSLKVTGLNATLGAGRAEDGSPLPLNLEVSGAVEVGPGAAINLDGAGYLGGRQGVNKTQAGRTLGNLSTGLNNAHGSHAGHGANMNVAPYGDYQEPKEAGGGGSGGPGAQPGGNGGGVLRLEAASLRLDGMLLASGKDSGSGYYSGAGGSIWLDVGALTGTGSMALVGGTSGGGGRVAVYYDESSTTFDWTRINAVGGYQGGGPGTVYLKAHAQPYGDLIVDNANGQFNPSTQLPTPLLINATGSRTFRNLTVTRKASLATPDALNITGTLTVDSSSRLQSSTHNLP
ncbi:Ig-like domain-containing protein [Corallococcus soli]|uniref:Ig-like domain-containing protein n=1 Tax=Corallococcus soli TaxID=2710757 RepID=UPI0039EDEFEE